ncbi:hypothetical protein [Enterococcus sp. DIV0774]|uniref:hypothetical protein n=1 Tax=Enterococcus sp. DIV0774 TaxID=2774989 RepID=UPI003D2FA145|nr:hypothetical protein [Enterococcus faecalis]
MMEGKIVSSTSSAQSAVSKLTGINERLEAPKVTFSGSTVSGMTKGKQVNAQVLTNLTDLANCVWKQAEKFPQIAEKIAYRDQQSAEQFSGGGR